jgi:hypothetical protein
MFFDSEAKLIKNRTQQKLFSESRQHRTSDWDDHIFQFRTDGVIIAELERYRSLFIPRKIS